MGFVSRFSFLLLSILLVAAGFASIVYTGKVEVWGLVTLFVTAGLTIFWVITRRGKLTPASPEKRLRKALGAGRPVVLHFYSNFNLGTLVKRVFTWRIERTFKGRCEFIYIDGGHPDAQTVATSVDARMGSYILYDARGHLFEKVGLINHQKLTDLLERPAR